MSWWQAILVAVAIGVVIPATLLFVGAVKIALRAAEEIRRG
jgi:hypothetical protein